MEISQLTTVYDARDDQHKAVTDRVIAREHATSIQIASELQSRGALHQQSLTKTEESSRRLESALLAASAAASVASGTTVKAAVDAASKTTEAVERTAAATRHLIPSDLANSIAPLVQSVNNALEESQQQMREWVTDVVAAQSGAGKAAGTAFNDGFVPTIRRAGQDAEQAVTQAAETARRSAAEALQDIQGLVPQIRRRTDEEVAPTGSLGPMDRAGTAHKVPRSAFAGDDEFSAWLQRGERAAAIKQRAKQLAAESLEEVERVNQQIDRAIVARQSLLGKLGAALPFGLGAKISGAKELGDDLGVMADAERVAAKEAGVLTSTLNTAGSTIKSVGGIALAAIISVAAGAVALGIVGSTIGSLAKTASDAGGALHELRQTTGLSVETLSALDHAAQMADTSAQALSGGILIFNRNLEAARQGTGRSKEQFRSLTGDLRDNEAAFAAVLSRLDAMPSGAERSAAAMQYFGRSGAQMLRVLDEGGGSLERLKRELRATGELLTGPEADAADKYGDAWKKAGLKLESIERHIGARFIPALTLLADVVDRQMGTAGKSVSAWGRLFDVVSLNITTNAITLQRSLEPVNQALSVIESTLRRISDATTTPTLLDVPAPAMPVDALPRPEVNTAAQEQEQIVQLAASGVAEAERQLREISAQQQILRQQGATSVRAAANVEIEASRRALDARVQQMTAEKQLLTERKNALDIDTDDSEKHRDKVLQIEGQLAAKQEEIENAYSAFAVEKARRLAEVRAEEIRQRREAMNASAQLAAREAQNLFQFEVTGAQRRYAAGLNSLEEYNRQRAVLEGQRYADERAALITERNAAKLLAQPEERVRATNEINQRIREAERAHITALHAIIQESKQERLAIDRQAAETLLQFRIQEDATEEQRYAYAVRQGEQTREDAETERFRRQRERARERLQAANAEAARLLQGTAPGVDEALRTADPEQLARTLSSTAYEFAGVDPDKLKAAQFVIASILEQMAADRLEHHDRMHNAGVEDLEDIQRYAEDLRSIYAEIGDINAQIMQSQIDIRGTNNFDRQATRDAQHTLDRAMEAARSARALAELHASRTAAGAIEDPQRRASQLRAINMRIQAEERLHQNTLTMIDHKAAEERRADLVDMAGDIAGILSSGLHDFNGDWNNVWQSMLQTALQTIQRIGDELLRMSLEVLLMGSTQGSSAGGIIGTLVNSIGGALFGNLLGGAFPVSSLGSGRSSLGFGNLTPGFTGRGFATGGVATGLGWVGEGGPELAYFAEPTRIFSHEQSMRMANGGVGGSGHVETNNYFISTPPSANKSYVQRRANRELSETIANTLKTRK